MVLGAAGGVAPRTWSLTAGSRPDGLVLGADGELGGTPTESGQFSFTATVTDGATPAAGTASVDLLLVVDPEPVRPPSFTQA